MAALKIALLGAPDTGIPQLADALKGAAKASGWQALIVVLADSLAHQADLASFDLVLLMGLQAPASSRISHTSARTLDLTREAADQSIRTVLADAAVSYRVLYGVSEERLAHALQAIQSLLTLAEARPRQRGGSGGVKNQPWVWMCDKCSDPQCEHLLLTALLARRASRV